MERRTKVLCGRLYELHWIALNWWREWEKRPETFNRISSFNTYMGVLHSSRTQTHKSTNYIHFEYCVRLWTERYYSNSFLYHCLTSIIFLLAFIHCSINRLSSNCFLYLCQCMECFECKQIINTFKFETKMKAVPWFAGLKLTFNNGHIKEMTREKAVDRDRTVFTGALHSTDKTNAEIGQCWRSIVIILLSFSMHIRNFTQFIFQIDFLSGRG